MNGIPQGSVNGPILIDILSESSFRSLFASLPRSGEEGGKAGREQGMTNYNKMI